MSKKLQIIAHSIVGVGLLALIIVAAFYDQSIASNIYIGTGISYVGAVIGKLPSWLFLAFAGSILVRAAYLKDKSYKSRIPLIIFYMLITVFASFMMGYSIVEDVISGSMLYLISGAVLLFALAANLLIVFRIKQDHIENLKKWAILAIITIGIIVVLTAGIKLLWGRARYMDIMVGDGTFTPWYKPNWFADGSSMPSGHTSLAAGMFLLPMLFLAIPNTRPYAASLYMLAMLYVIFIAITRMLGGYHFLSDVTVSLGIAYATTFIVYYIGYGRGLRNTRIKPESWLNKI